MAADAADDLYGLPLDAFVPERDALAKRLRADGKRDEADEIKALRKPSVAAWAVNQVVRTQPKESRALWKAGDALIGAQEALLAGTGDAAALRTAVEDERAAVDGLLEAARGLLTGEGRDLGETTLERVRETLHAGAIDAEAREDVAAGRAVRERAHAGLGPFGAAPEATPAARRSGGATKARLPKARGKTPKEDADPAPSARAKGAKAKAAGKAGTRPKGRAKEPTKAERAAEEKAAATREREAERKAAAEQERERRAAARARADAEREMREARKALDKAQRAADRANAKLADAQAVADEADAALDEAQERDRAAVAELERTGGKPPA